MDIISIPVPGIALPEINFTLTFRPYLNYIKGQIAATKSTVYKQFLESIAAIIIDNPELQAPITDLSVLNKHQELIELIKITHLSQVKSDGFLYTLGLPAFDKNAVNYFGFSQEFKTFFQEKGEQLIIKSDFVNDEFQRNIYKDILRKVYGITNLEGSTEVMMHMVDNSTAATQFYKIIRRHQFADISTQLSIPELRQEWVDYAIGVIRSHNELEVPLPFKEFKMEGFFIFSIIPDTEEMALLSLSNSITQIHVSDEQNTFQKMREATVSLVGNEQIEVGFLPFLKVNGAYVYHDIFTTISLVFERLKNHFSQDELNQIFNEMVNKSSASCGNVMASLHNEVYQLDDDCNEQKHLKSILSNEGLNSLKFIPVWHKNELLGIVELGSKDATAINAAVLRKLEMALPYYREYFMYKANAFSDYLKSFIMQRYTAIQDSVSWKFNEEVWNTLKDLSSDRNHIMTPPVKFDNLYPFYGAIDFRNSSLKQIEAIHADYKAQLHFLEQLLEENGLTDEEESTRDFAAQIKYWCNKINDSIHIEEEADLRYFLEVASLHMVKQLAKDHKIETSVAEAYDIAVSTKDGVFHLFHNKYEESLQQLNSILKEHLYKAEENLQQLVPHYFEKFQTDGLEYSLYAGKSIRPSVPFPDNAREIITNWQMDSIVDMAVAASKNKHKLTVPLETTQLILVHENKVDISYRIDERHFDVQGSYSIRYEVIKKRIDKVHLLNSAERLTQPGTIAIVYTHRNSINAYLDKINDLTENGRLLPGVEYLDLEQLQGIGKLKAIRVKINFDTNSTTLESAKAYAINN
ncbi:MAG TPA: hypothetical protein VL092_06090 [Chitinophagaceae bacterium]|nr:hypothetical protein [Chitinophagaceae bacterium]